MALLDFNITDYEASGVEYQLIPSGWQIFRIIDVEMKLTAKAIKEKTNDCYLNIKLMIEGENNQWAKRCIWDKINIVNSNEEAQNIGRRRLRGIAQILKLEELLDKTRDTNCLIGGIIGGYVDFDFFNGKESNKIKNFKDPNQTIVSNRLVDQSLPCSVKKKDPNQVLTPSEIEAQAPFDDDIPF